MRKLMWFAVGFATACGICAYMLPKEWILPAIGIVLLLLGVSCVFQQKRKYFRIGAMTLLGCTAGLMWFLLFTSQYLAGPLSADGTEQILTVTVTDFSYDTDYGTTANGTVLLEDKTYQVRTYLNKMDTLSPGDRVTATFLCRATMSDSEESGTYHPGMGIYLLLYQKSQAEVVVGQNVPVFSFAAELRRGIKDILESLMPENTIGFAKALLLGDTSDLSYETDMDLKISGIRHIAAVSGLHISILFSLICMVTCRKRYLILILGLPLLGIAAAVAGFTPSVVRACIMCALMILASALDREYDGLTSLSFAVLVMLVLNPMAITSVSMQLSVASVAGIFLFRERIHNWLLSCFKNPTGKRWKNRLINWICASVSVSVSAMIFTTPICGAYFGMVSLIGVVTNLLVLWLVSFLFYGLMALCGLYLIWQGGSAVLGKFLGILIGFVLKTAHYMAEIPLAAVYTDSIYVIVWLTLVYLLLLIFLVWKKIHPRTLLCAICIGLCVTLMISLTDTINTNCRVTVLDVGQGQSILLETEGRTFLVDCGGDREKETATVISGTLFSRGIRHLDGIILTHYDADHAGALDYLLSRVQTDLLLVPDTVDAKDFSQVSGKVIYIRDTAEITVGNSKITVFGPIYSGSSNENSLCILFESEDCDILITGDRSDFGERMLMRKTNLPDVDLLIAGHHGSKDSTSEELLRTVTPETVIISAGLGNIYGHPHQELLDRLAQFGCTVLRTDLDGTIIYRR